MHIGHIHHSPLFVAVETEAEALGLGGSLPWGAGLRASDALPVPSSLCSCCALHIPQCLLSPELCP